MSCNIKTFNKLKTITGSSTLISNTNLKIKAKSDIKSLLLIPMWTKAFFLYFLFLLCEIYSFCSAFCILLYTRSPSLTNSAKLSGRFNTVKLKCLEDILKKKCMTKKVRKELMRNIKCLIQIQRFMCH